MLKIETLLFFTCNVVSAVPIFTICFKHQYKLTKKLVKREKVGAYKDKKTITIQITK